MVVYCKTLVLQLGSVVYFAGIFHSFMLQTASQLMWENPVLLILETITVILIIIIKSIIFSTGYHLELRIVYKHTRPNILFSHF